MLRIKIKNKLLEQQPTAQPVQQPGQTAQPQTSGKLQIKTFGDLKKVINQIILNKRLGAAGGSTTGAVVDFAIDKGVDILKSTIPGLGVAKTLFDVFKSVYQATDDKKTNTILDKLNVDDEYSKIVDDKVEMAFLKTLSSMFMNKPDNEVIPADYDINKELELYLAKTHKARTLSKGT